MTTLTFPQRMPAGSAPVYIADRPRFAPLTSLRFVAPDRIVCGDFMHQTLIHVRLLPGGDYDVLDERPSVDGLFRPVSTDLIDFDGRDRVVTSNFLPGTQTIYRIEDGRLIVEREIPAHERPAQCHGVRFVPDAEDRLLATYNSKSDPMLCLIDCTTGVTIWSLRTEAQPQDIALVGCWMLVPARTDHISRNGQPREAIRATLYLYWWADRTKPPILVDTWQGDGHLDATAVYQNRVYIANQYHDRVEVFAIAEAERLEHVETIEGFDFPHGLDVRADGLLAVTNYGDNSIRLLPLAEAA